MRHCSSILSTLAGWLLLTAAVSHATITPYVSPSTDSATTHLWTFDENTGTSAADTGFNASSTPYNLTLSGAASWGTSATGFGSALSTTGGTGDIAKSGNTTSRPQDGQLVGSNGSFSLDMLVKINDLDQGDGFLLTYESTGSSGNRVLHVWYNHDLSGPTIQFEAIGSSAPEWALPTTGPNAVDTTDWFHLGFSYDSTTATVTSYWTKVDPTNTVATVLGTGAFNNLKSTTATVIGVSNSSRAPTTTASFNGSIDELRISTVARGAGDFIFHPAPEPSTFVLAGIGLAALVAVGKTRRK